MSKNLRQWEKMCIFFLFRSVIFAIYQKNSYGKQYWILFQCNEYFANIKSSQKLPKIGYLIQYQQDTILYEADLNQTRVSSLGTLKLGLPGLIFQN